MNDYFLRFHLFKIFESQYLLTQQIWNQKMAPSCLAQKLNENLTLFTKFLMKVCLTWRDQSVESVTVKVEKNKTSYIILSFVAFIFFMCRQYADLSTLSTSVVENVGKFLKISIYSLRSRVFSLVYGFDLLNLNLSIFFN